MSGVNRTQPARAWPLGAFELDRPVEIALQGRRRAFVAATVLVDAVAANLSVLLALLARFEGTPSHANWAAFGHLWLPSTAALVACHGLMGLYTRSGALSRQELSSAAIRANAMWLSASFAIAYARPDLAAAYPIAVLFLSAAFNAVISFWVHLSLERVRRTLLDPARRVRRAVLVGATAEGRRLLDAASTQANFEYLFADVIEDRRGRDREPDLGRVVREREVEEVILADPDLETRDLLHYLVQCAGLRVRFTVVPSTLELVHARGRVRLVAGVPLVDLFGDGVPTMTDVGKRIADVVLACLGLAITLPVWPLVALAVKLSSPGPAWFRQERVGLWGRTFQMFKFRTMGVNAEARTGPTLATLDDHRVTLVGRFLRRSRLDELPQLLNVLLGDMSLVGPRPERPCFVRQFLKSVPAYAHRYSVRPGITGLAQVQGGYEATARNKARYDLLYIKNRSPWLDLKILAKTVGVVLRGKGAQ